MADFVAVIRRAVDGLANNTPEMRVRVYEKARSAVQRQLENMKPRPSDDMLRRQLEKLDAAIASVEAEHAEALPEEPVPVFATEEPLATPPAEPEPAPLAEQPSYAAEPPPYIPEQAPPAFAEPAHAAPPADEPRPQEPAVFDAPAPSSQDIHPDDERGASFVDEEPASASIVAPVEAPAPYTSHEPDTFAEPEPPVTAAPADVTWQPEEPATPAEPEPVLHSQREAVYDQSTFHEQVDPEPPAEEPYQAPVAAEPVGDVFAEFSEQRPARAPSRADWPDAPSTAPLVRDDPFADADDRIEPEPVEAAPVHAAPLSWDQPETVAAEPVNTANQAPAAPEAVFDDWPPLPPYDEPNAGGVNAAQEEWPDLAQPAHEPVSAHFDEERHESASARMPSVSDLPDLSAPAARSPAQHNDDELLAEFLKPASVAVASAAAAGAASAAAPKPGKSDDPWNDLEELIGYDGDGANAGTTAGGTAPAAGAESRAESAELEALMAAPVARSYRATPKPKRRFAPILLGVLGLLLLGGGGYAVWMNRSALDSLVGEVTTPSSSQPQTASSPPTATQTPATAPAAGNGAQAPATTAQPTSAPATAAGTDAAGPNKFTQRLLPNGSEVDNGAGGPTAGTPGQSVAQLNAPPADGAAPAGQAAQAPAQTPGQAPSQAPAQTPAPPGNPSEAPALAGEKIFLYEERIGQSSPVAVEGSVSWSLQNEAGENGKPEPVVQGRINVPERGLTALVTFKRNTDQSLPASHLVEFVFSLPQNFEGGAIDSVQRISMKGTEQDRGDPLIAVPAKITPDFHMIALNDFPDARARNLELLRTRNWIDVPLVYSTGRRALLTLQKGTEGAKAFDEAIRGWQAMAPPQGQ